MEWDKKECERECNCCIEIEESIVLILCDEVNREFIHKRKNYIDWEQKVNRNIGGNHMEWEKDKKRECNCCIEIEESLVLILCDEVDIDKFKDYLKAYAEVKGNKKVASQE